MHVSASCTTFSSAVFRVDVVDAGSTAYCFVLMTEKFHDDSDAQRTPRNASWGHAQRACCCTLLHAAKTMCRCRYVSDLHQLRKYGACLHLLQQPPAAIIVDDVAHLLANMRWVRGVTFGGCLMALLQSIGHC